MKSLNELKQFVTKDEFDLEHESNMVQSRILSPIIDAIEAQGLTQEQLSELTGLTQPFISGLLNIRKKLSVGHIALFQKALGIVLQPPTSLSYEEHKSRFYSSKDYNEVYNIFWGSVCHHVSLDGLNEYKEDIAGNVWIESSVKTTQKLVSSNAYRRKASKPLCYT